MEEFDRVRRHVHGVPGPLPDRQALVARGRQWPQVAVDQGRPEAHTCATCGFFVPLKGELNLLFGVCANKWSPDDGRVVSLDHGCGEHSEIEPPEPTHLWVQSKPGVR